MRVSLPREECYNLLELPGSYEPAGSDGLPSPALKRTVVEIIRVFCGMPTPKILPSGFRMSRALVV